MDYLDDAVDAIGNLLCEAAFAGFDAAVDQHQASRATGAELRDGAVALALFGPSLNKLAEEIIGEAVRKTVARYNAYRRHPRYRRDALVFELEDAQKSLNDAILNTSGMGPALHAFYLAIAIIRVRAITIAIGSECIPEPPPAPLPPTGPPLTVPSRQQPVATAQHADKATYSPSTPFPQRAGNEAAAPGRGADLAAKFARQARSQSDARQRLADAHAKHGRPKS